VKNFGLGRLSLLRIKSMVVIELEKFNGPLKRIEWR